MGQQIHDKLVDYLQDAHAMEKDSAIMLRSMLQHTDDPEMREMLEHHASETEQHQQRVRQRLETLGTDPSNFKESGVLLSTLAKGIVDQIRSDKPGKDARDGYLTEQTEIAAYELLKRLAQRAGDNETVQIAEQNLKDEYAMAEKISSKWDKVIDLTLEKEGVSV